MGWREKSKTKNGTAGYFEMILKENENMLFSVQ
jgi:hypothetical protein